MRFWGVQRFHFFNCTWTIVFYSHTKMDVWGEVASIRWCFEIDPKKTWTVLLRALQLTCNCHCCWPSLFLPSRVASKRAQGFSNKVDILEIIRQVCFQRQVCIWNKHMIIFPRINQRQRKFMYSIVLFYFIKNVFLWIFFSCFQIISYSDSIWFSSFPTNVCYPWLSSKT